MLSEPPGGCCQPVCVDVDADTAAGTGVMRVAWSRVSSHAIGSGLRVIGAPLRQSADAPAELPTLPASKGGYVTLVSQFKPLSEDT